MSFLQRTNKNKSEKRANQITFDIKQTTKIHEYEICFDSSSNISE